MVIHRSKFKKTLGPIARGTVYFSEDKEFRVSRNITILDEKTRLEKKIKIFYIFKKEDYNCFQKPSRNLEVLMRYHDSKSKEGKYQDQKKNLPFEVLSLKGELLYRERFI